LLEAFQFSKPLVLIVLLLLVIASASFARFLIEAFTRNSKGTESAEVEKALPHYVVRNGMKFPILSIIFMIFALGIFFPGFLENLLNGIVHELGYI
jgi:hydrogenase-4 component F